MPRERTIITSPSSNTFTFNFTSARPSNPAYTLNPSPVVSPITGVVLGTVGDFQIIRPADGSGYSPHDYIVKRGKYWARYMNVYDEKRLYLDGNRSHRVMNIPPLVIHAIINWFETNQNIL